MNDTITLYLLIALISVGSHLWGRRSALRGLGVPFGDPGLREAHERISARIGTALEKYGLKNPGYFVVIIKAVDASVEMSIAQSSTSCEHGRAISGLLTSFNHPCDIDKPKERT